MWNLRLSAPSPSSSSGETCVEWISQQAWPLGKENLERTWVLSLQRKLSHGDFSGRWLGHDLWKQGLRLSSLFSVWPLPGESPVLTLSVRGAFYQGSLPPGRPHTHISYVCCYIQTQ